MESLFERKGKDPIKALRYRETDWTKPVTLEYSCNGPTPPLPPPHPIYIRNQRITSLKDVPPQIKCDQDGKMADFIVAYNTPPSAKQRQRRKKSSTNHRL